MLEGKKAVLFDLDGTLVDSMGIWHEIDIEYLGRYGYEVPQDLERAIQGMGFTETAQYFKKRFLLQDSIEEIKNDWMMLAGEKYAHEVKLKQGAAELLGELQKNGILIGIASSNSRELILSCLEQNGVADCFDCIVTSCEVAKGKPAPDVYLRAAELLNTAPEFCLVFEDVPMGILAGKNAGMQVCAVKDRHCEDQTEEIQRLADFYIETFEQVR